VKAVFVELPPFRRWRPAYLTDEDYRAQQQALMADPEGAPVIPKTGGLRKLRWRNSTNNKGKRGGHRVIYYAWSSGNQFWLFTVYGKDEVSDLSEDEKKTLGKMLKAELKARETPGGGQQ
jgi:hypothetical protein